MKKGGNQQNLGSHRVNENDVPRGFENSLILSETVRPSRQRATLFRRWKSHCVGVIYLSCACNPHNSNLVWRNSVEYILIFNVRNTEGFQVHIENGSDETCPMANMIWTNVFFVGSLREVI